MDAKSRRQSLLLVVLVAVLGALVWWNFGPSGPAATPRRAARTQGAAARAQEIAPVPRVKLDALAAPRPAPNDASRDPFRFGGFAAPRVEDDRPLGEPGGASQAAAAAAQAVPAGPPPIPLRFIGVVRVPKGQQLVAVLSDGVGIYRGTEGDIIEGRYRVVRVGLESVELAYVDGRGHQVIRISGS